MKRVERAESEAAAVRIASHAVRTPLVKLNWTRPDAPQLEIYLKLESLQPISSFKVRGAVNTILSRIERAAAAGNPIDASKMHVVTASAGNMGQGVAYAAVSVGCPKCTVIVPDSAPATKLDAIRRWNDASANTEVVIIEVPYDRWWEIIMNGDVSPELGEDNTVTFIHPVIDQDNMTGHSTIGLEIEEDLPDAEAVYVAWGGGGCCSGIASVLAPNAKIFSCEPETAAPICASLAAGEMTKPNFTPSFVDGCGGKSVLPPMWPLAQQLLTGAASVPLDQIEIAIATMLRRNRIVAEGAGACSVAAAMFGEEAKTLDKVVCVVCGGCLDSSTLIDIINRHGDEAATELASGSNLDTTKQGRDPTKCAKSENLSTLVIGGLLASAAAFLLTRQLRK